MAVDSEHVIKGNSPVTGGESAISSLEKNVHEQYFFFCLVNQRVEPTKLGIDVQHQPCQQKKALLRSR